jgi:predicted  nucleic acid-binding Zn-ribbon protein
LALLSVQEKDSALAQLAHRRAALPENARIQELTARAEELTGQRVEAETQVGDLERAQKKFDAEVELVRQRRVRDEERLSSGVITNPKDLSSLQHELGALDRRISSLEDEELEIMEQLEQAQALVAEIANELEAVQADLSEVSAARDIAVQEIDTETLELQTARDAAAAGVDPGLAELYEKVRAQHGGVGAAALRARRCEGCRLEINGADLREIAAKPDDEVLRCPECSRILVRTSESGL